MLINSWNLDLTDDDTFSDEVSRSSTLPSIQEEDALSNVSNGGSVRSRRSIRATDGSKAKEAPAQDRYAVTG